MPLTAMSRIQDVKAVADLQKYFEVRDDGRLLYTGSRFEKLAGGGDAVDPNRITANDLIAVASLAVHVPGQAALGILGPLAEDIESLLRRIPADVALEGLSPMKFQELMGPGSPAEVLWQLLRQPKNRWGVGQTTASKILARKRPHLIPIYDSIIARQTGMKNSTPQWTEWFKAFQGDDGSALKERLTAIRRKARQPHLSTLRVLDIILWMDGRGTGPVRESVGDPE